MSTSLVLSLLVVIWFRKPIGRSLARLGQRLQEFDKN